jgi:hypothetical protein
MKTHSNNQNNELFRQINTTIQFVLCKPHPPSRTRNWRQLFYFVVRINIINSIHVGMRWLRIIIIFFFDYTIIMTY